MCLTGAVVACWSLTQEMASSSPFTVIRNILVTEFTVTEVSETFRINFCQIRRILTYHSGKI